MKTLNILLAGLCLAGVISCKQAPVETCDKADAVIENIMARRSIRKYKEGPVARETMQTILECGINAPSGQNRQSWEVRVVDNLETMDEIISLMAAGNPAADPGMIKGCFRGCPTMIFIANDPSYDFSVIDCGLLSQNIMLSGHALGVGSVCLGSPVRFLRNAPEAIAKLGFSEGYTPVICIGMGYPDEAPEAKPRDFGKVKFVD
ncbi:MAG: nitroreductase [Bacteroidales bacterium]|nr:nitroreductase [Bacteroidales bacterium]